MTCYLCSAPSPDPIVDEERHFCCRGCHAVFLILEAKKGDGNASALFAQAAAYGLIAHPPLEAKKELLLECKRLYLQISGMWCPSCAELLHLLLIKKEAVKSCFVDYATDHAYIDYYPQKIDPSRLIKEIASFGYQPLLLGEKKRDRSLYLRLAVASFSALNIMMLSYPLYGAYFGIAIEGYRNTLTILSFVLSLPILFYSALPIFKRFWLSLKVRHFGMDALVVVGISSASLLSFLEILRGSNHIYLDSMSMIVVFLLWGKVLESKAKRSNQEKLLQFEQSLPKRARKAQGFVPIKEIQVGDFVTVLTGEKVVLDGVVTEGRAAVDESLLTGEVMPLLKERGAQLLAGSLLKSGMLTFKVTRLVEESLLQKMTFVLGQDVQKKSHRQELVDRITQFFVPTLFLLGLSTGDMERFLATLLVACPCAIGIAIPLVEAQLIHKLMQIGVILRDRRVLEHIGREELLLFDKTGTLTMGQFTLLSSIEEEREALLGLALISIHPIALAIQEALDVAPLAFSYREEIIGKGIRGVTLGDVYLLGSSDFMRENNIDVVDNNEVTTVFFAKNSLLLQEITLGDRLRPGTEVIAELHAKKVILSGDGKAAVAKVAEQVGISEWHAHLTPFEKRAFVESAQKEGKRVAMLGDGVNDALSLSLSEVSMSWVGSCDLSMHTSSVLLTTPSLEVLPKMYHLCRRARRLMHQNLFWAFFYNLIGVVLALFGFFPPIVAAAAMVISSLFVIFNSRRI